MSEDRKLEEIKRRMLERLMREASRSSLLSDGVVNVINDANFEEAISGSSPVLVDFWAEWCMPCRIMAPIVESLARDYAGRIQFAKLNTDENQTTSARFRVMSIPYFALFKDGRRVDQALGAVSRQVLEALLMRNM